MQKEVGAESWLECVKFKLKCDDSRSPHLFPRANIGFFDNDENISKTSKRSMSQTQPQKQQLYYVCLNTKLYKRKSDWERNRRKKRWKRFNIRKIYVNIEEEKNIEFRSENWLLFIRIFSGRFDKISTTQKTLVSFNKINNCFGILHQHFWETRKKAFILSRTM